MPPRPVRLIVAAGVLTAALALPGTATAADPEVTISGDMFSPATVTVGVGDTVTWANTDRGWHTAGRAEWATGLIMGGATRSITFAEAGTFSYACTIHPSMRGTIVVEGVAAAARVTNGDGTLTVPASDSVIDGAGARGGPPALVVVGLLALAAVAGFGLGDRRFSLALARNRARQLKRYAASSPWQRGPRPYLTTPSVTSARHQNTVTLVSAPSSWRQSDGLVAWSARNAASWSGPIDPGAGPAAAGPPRSSSARPSRTAERRA
jgi:plastocyanin